MSGAYTNILLHHLFLNNEFVTLYIENVFTTCTRPTWGLRNLRSAQLTHLSTILSVTSSRTRPYTYSWITRLFLKVAHMRIHYLKNFPGVIPPDPRRRKGGKADRRKKRKRSPILSQGVQGPLAGLKTALVLICDWVSSFIHTAIRILGFSDCICENRLSFDRCCWSTLLMKFAF
jgi:hypothetical protein